MCGSPVSSGIAGSCTFARIKENSFVNCDVIATTSWRRRRAAAGADYGTVRYDVRKIAYVRPIPDDVRAKLTSGVGDKKVQGSAQNAKTVGVAGGWRGGGAYMASSSAASARM
ncbi:hypothetical protein Aduo_016505 [Ancylostoma duodenale]